MPAAPVAATTLTLVDVVAKPDKVPENVVDGYVIAELELKEKKMIDTIEDENGEEVVFLTKKGKEFRKTYQDTDKDC